MLSAFSCKGKNPETLIPHINGYWQIEEAQLSDGRKREYNFSENIDYIEVGDSMIGFRKKLKPRIDGTFQTSNSLERFELKIENDSLNVYYSTPYSEWKETILNATESSLLISNANNDIYLYERYTPLNLN